MKGIGVYLQHLLPEMAALDSSIAYILFYDTRQAVTPRLPAGPGFRERGISLPRGDTFYAWEQLRLPLATRHEAVDVFHSPANTTPCWKPAPTIVTVHDVKLLEATGDGVRSRLYHRPIQQFAIRRAAAVICPSEFTKREVLKHFRIEPGRVTVIHNGVGTQFHPLADHKPIESVRHKYGINGDFVLFAGGESAPKNISTLLAAFAVVCARCEDILLVVPGIRTETILQAHLAEAKRLHVERRIIFPGYIPEAELIALMNAARLFVYPSLSEGFGLPPLEAMACGAPVAASDATSIPEVVGDAALLFEASSVNATAEAIERLLTDSSLCRLLRDKGFRRAAHFTWRRAAEATLQVYYEAASTPQSVT
jgi:glycosyltransferase involved in cell wall biosynthesis